jgi:hypothetical protein
MKALFTVLFVSALTIAMAQGGAKISFSNTTHDFGTLEEGPQAATEFVFKNEGTEPLILENVKASCGCTVPAWPKEPILPGETGSIKVNYNTSRRPGQFTKSITITSNADESTKVIYIKGNVVPAAEEETMPIKQPANMLAPAGK